MKPIKNDDDLVGVIDELKHQIKEGVRSGPMCFEFNEMLNKFIAQWRLGEDPDAFAEWPKYIAMKCPDCGVMEPMDRVDGEPSLYACTCGARHKFKGNYEEFEKEET